MSVITTIIAVNQTGTDIELPRNGATIPASGSLDLTSFLQVFEIQADPDLKTRISAGDILINDGTTTLTMAQSLSAVTVQAGHYDVDTSISKASAAFDAYSTSTASITGTDFLLPLNVERFAPDAAYFTHSADSADVTINTTGRYQLVYRASVLSSGILLLVIRGRLQRDTGGGFVDVPGTISFSGGIDLLGVQASVGCTAVLDLSSGDLVRVAVNRITGTGASALISGGSSLTITGMP